MALKTIAAGIDERPLATDALAWAVGLANAEDAALQVVHVWQTAFLCTYPWSCPSTEEEIQHARTVLRDAMTTVGVDRHVESIIVRGAAGPALVDASANADLLVIGRIGENLVDFNAQFGEIMTGATARYCINHATRPVVTIPEGSKWVDAPHVIVGIDGSPTSLAALRWAAEHLPTDATVHAVRAVSSSAPDEGGLPVELLDPIVDQELNELRELVAASTPAAFTESGRVIHTHVVHGYAIDALTDPGFSCDVVVVGEHGETAKPNELGSVADHTLRNSRVPLIVVPFAAEVSV